MRRSARTRRRVGNGNSWGAPSAAGLALIGETACVKWEQKLDSASLRGVRVPYKDDNFEGSTSNKINDDAHCDRRSPGCVAVHSSRGRHPRTDAIDLQEKQRALINLGHEQAPSPASRSGCQHAPHVRRAPRSVCGENVPKNTLNNAEPAEKQSLIDTQSTDETTAISLRTSRDVRHGSSFTHDDARGPHDRCYHSSRRPWARMTLLLWSELRQLIKPNRPRRRLARIRLLHDRREKINTQVGKLFPAASRDRETRLLEGGKAAARESSGGGGHRLEDGRAEEQGLQSAARTTLPTSTCAHARNR